MYQWSLSFIYKCSVEKTKLFVFKVNVFMEERDKYFSSYMVFAKGSILSFPGRLRRKYGPGQERKQFLSPLLKNGNLPMTLELKLRM